MSHKSALVGLSYLLPALAMADPQQDPGPQGVSGAALEEVIVTAQGSRLPENLESFPGSVSVLDEELLHDLRRSTSDFGAILGLAVPGLAAGTQGNSSNFDQSMRGRIPAVLIDGVPIGTPLRDGRRDIRSISPAAIERVEVIRGSSALYGNGGAGGVINYITKTGGTGNSRHGIDVGSSFSLTHTGDSAAPYAELSGVGEVGPIDYNVSLYGEQTAGSFDADGDRIRPDPNGQGGLADSTTYNLFVKLGSSFGRQRIEASLLKYDQTQDSDYNGVINGNLDTGVPAQPFRAPIDARGMDATNENRVINLVYAHQDVFGSSLRLQAYDQKYRNIFSFATPSLENPAGGAPIIYSEKHGARLDIDTPLPIGIASSLLWGVDYVEDATRQDLVNPTLSGPSYRRINAPEVTQEGKAAFVQGTYGINARWTLRGGARYEVNDVSWNAFNVLANGTTTSAAPGIAIPGRSLDYSATTFNGGINFAATDNIDLFVAYSEGFSVTEVGRLLRQASTANAALRSNLEASIVENSEIGARFRFGGTKASLAVFRAESNLGTTLVPGSTPSTFTVARSPEEVYGLEATVDSVIGARLRLGGSLTLMEGKRDSDNNGTLDRKLPSNRVPPTKVTAYGDYAWNDLLRSRVQVLYSAQRDEFDQITLLGEGPIDAYTLVDLTTTLDLSKRGVFTLTVANLFNEDYFSLASQILRSPAGYSKAPGATVKLTYVYEF